MGKDAVSQKRLDDKKSSEQSRSIDPLRPDVGSTQPHPLLPLHPPFFGLRTTRGPHSYQSQALPRHMRRRTTSHTPRRMPLALKNSGRAAPNNGRSGSSSKNKHSGRRHGSVANSSRSKGDGSGAGVDMDVDAQRCRKHRRRPRSLLEMHSPHAVPDEESGGEDEAGKGRTPR